MTAPGLAQRPRLLAGIGIGALCAAGWIGLAGLGHDGWPRHIAELCLSTAIPPGDAYPAVAAMWLLMSVAMMLPTAAPAIDLYARLARRMETGRSVAVPCFAAGYLAAWGGFGLIAAGAQLWLGRQAVDLTAGPAAGVLLMLAGGYQVTPLKAACLTLCRNPLAFFMSAWREGWTGALHMGFRHGLVCIGCCWALMGLMLLAGAMNLIWMAALGLLMLAEKTLPHADRAGRLVGVGLALAGAALIVDAMT